MSTRREGPVVHVVLACMHRRSSCVLDHLQTVSLTVRLDTS
jgi:hypothetical protein